jgi:hypothetical protein
LFKDVFVQGIDDLSTRGSLGKIQESVDRIKSKIVLAVFAHGRTGSLIVGVAHTVATAEYIPLENSIKRRLILYGPTVMLTSIPRLAYFSE